MSGFYAYIDESGDEGFVFDRPGKSSTQWFVISAVVTRAETDIATVRLMDDARAAIGRNKPLHFCDIEHEKRVPVLDRIARAQVRTISVLIHKPSIKEPENFDQPHSLYRYATRYLLERVSWLSRDHRKDPSHTARLVFSNRSSMSYDDMRDYFALLQKLPDVRIDWSPVETEKLRVAPHAKLSGLQIADFVASGMAKGVEVDRYGFVEPRYAAMLKPTVYAHKGQRMGHGFKLWPAEALASPRPELAWIHQTFGLIEAGPRLQDPAR